MLTENIKFWVNSEFQIRGDPSFTRRWAAAAWEAETGWEAVTRQSIPLS